MRSFLINQDIYGHVIGVHYKGSGTFNTGLGGLCTIITYLLIIFNLFILGEGLIDQSLQSESTQVNSYDNFNTEKYQFDENDLDIVLLQIPEIPSYIGQYKMYQNLGLLDDLRKIEIPAKNCS